MKKFSFLFLLLITMHPVISQTPLQSEETIEKTSWNWPKKVNGIQGYETFVSDINGNSLILISTPNTLFNYEYSGESGIWDSIVAPSNHSFTDAPAIGDINGDGKPDIVAIADNYSNNTSRIIAIDSDYGYMHDGFPVSLNVQSPSFGSKPVLVDINNDGLLEILTTTENRYTGETGVICIDGFGNTLWSYTNLIGTMIGIACGDIDADNDIEIVVQDSKNISILSHNGQLVDDCSQPYNTIGHTDNLILADVNNNGNKEIICTGANYSKQFKFYVNVLDNSLNPISSFWPYITNDGTGDGISVTDLNDDDLLEVLFYESSSLNGKRIFAFDYMGNSPTGWPVTTSTLFYNQPSINTISTNQGNLKIILQAGDYSSNTKGYHVYNTSGTLDTIFQTSYNPISNTHPIICDLDCDGNYEMLCAGKESGNTYIYIEPTNYTVDIKNSYMWRPGFDRSNTWTFHKKPILYGDNLDGWFHFEELVVQNKTMYIKNIVDSSLLRTNHATAAGQNIFSNKVQLIEKSISYAENNQTFDYPDNSFSIVFWANTFGYSFDKYDTISQLGYKIDSEFISANYFECCNRMFRLKLGDNASHIYTMNYNNHRLNHWNLFAVVINRVRPDLSFMYLSGQTKQIDLTNLLRIGPVNSPFIIGQHENRYSYYNRAIDELMVFNKAISKEAIDSIYFAREKGCIFSPDANNKSSFIENERLINQKNSFVDIFPNPATEHLTIASKDYSIFEGNIKIYHLNGKLLIDQVVTNNSTYNISVSDLETGLYIIEVITNKYTSTSKLIIQ